MAGPGSMIERVSIVGVGLIGGSLAMAWQERLPRLEIIGYDRPDVLGDAIARGAVDDCANSLQDAVERADVVVFATPIASISTLLQEAAGWLKPDTIVTDVGSVKAPINEAARQHFSQDQVFIGGHPMAGAEQGGLANADAFLFENATYVLCPGPHENTEAYNCIAELVEATGARVLTMDASHHDRVAACISHVPQLLATALMGLAAEKSQADPAILRLAAGGFRDMTRIASSPYSLWAPILSANRTDVRAILEELIATLKSMHDVVERDEIVKLAPLFDQARSVRETIPKDFKGFVDPLADVYVYAKDRPGVLAHMTGALSKNDISIKDIELLKVREGTGGAFRLSFTDDRTADAAVATLKAVGCRAYRLN